MNIQDILDSISDGLDALLQQLIANKHGYHGKFGNVRKVLKYKHRKGNGLRIGNRYTSIQHTLHGGMLLIGKTGIGKSTKVFFQNLFGAKNTVPTSFICLDPTEELRDKAMAYMEQELEYEEDVINFSDASKSTVCWSPIENVSLAQINRFAGELVAIEGGENTSQPIWNNTSTAIISMMIRLLKRIEIRTGTKKYTNLYNVRYLVTLLQASLDKMNILMAKYGDEMLFTSYKALVKNHDKILNSAISNTLSILKNWEDEQVIKTTSNTTLNMASYRDEKRILWIQNSVMSQKYLTGINSLFLKEWFANIMEAGIPDKQSNVLAFLIDEASSLKTSDRNFIPFITSQIRKYKAYGIWGFQSFSQCINLYGKEGAETLKSNTGTVLYLGEQPLATATEISKSLGRYSYSENEKKLTREVMTPEEVMHTGAKDGGILIANAHRPILLKRVKAYYQNRKFSKWAEEPASEILGGTMPMPPLLPIDELIGEVKRQKENSDSKK